MSDLIIPVYLNQRLVFDLVAMLQNGISTVSRLEIRSTEDERDMQRASGRFSLADAFGSLLKIDMDASKETDRNTQQQRTESTEKTHTPASLFSLLRGQLAARQLLVSPAVQAPVPGDFVEFKASMRRNPLIEGLDQSCELLSMADLFSEQVSQTVSRQKTKQVQSESELSVLAKQLRHINARLQEGTTRDLFATDAAGGYSAVVTVENQFLNDDAMTDLIDGTFSVLGKVIRVVTNENGKISLVRNSAVNMSPHLLAELVQSFKNLQAVPGFSTPEMTYEVPGPAFQVLPIAIFA